MMNLFTTLPLMTGGSTGGSEGAANDPTYTKTLFVGKADNSTESGTLLEPFHTWGAAISAASGLTPGPTNKICIFGFAGSYGEAGLSVPDHVYLAGIDPETVILTHSNKILTVAVSNTSVSGIGFLPTSTNAIISIDGTSMTDIAIFRNCIFSGAGSSSNVVLCENGGLARLYDCRLEAQNVGQTILQTDSDSSNNIRLYNSVVIGDIAHAGGELELTDLIYCDSEISCTGSSDISITDSFCRNSIGDTVQLGTTGNVYFYRSTIISPGFVNPDNYYAVRVSAVPATCEWIDSSFIHDGIAPDYSVYSSVEFSFVGDRTDFEFGYNSNITDAGLSTKAVPADTDFVIIEDSEDRYRRKRVQLGDLPGGGGGASNLSELAIDTDKDWLGFDITNIGALAATDQFTAPLDASPVASGDIAIDTSEEELVYTVDGATWLGAGSPARVYSSATGVAEGNNSLTGLKNKYLIKCVKISTTSARWTLTAYSSDDYASDPVTVLANRNGDLMFIWDFPYSDIDDTAEFHYNFTDSVGSATHDIELWGTSLR